MLSVCAGEYVRLTVLAFLPPSRSVTRVRWAPRALRSPCHGSFPIPDRCDVRVQRELSTRGMRVGGRRRFCLAHVRGMSSRVRARCIRMRFCSTTAHGSPRVPHRRWSHPHPMRCVCLVSTCSPATLRHAPSRAYAAAGPREPFVLRASFPSRVRAVSNFGRLMLRVFSIIVWRNLFFTAVVTGDTRARRVH
jgi:hypothetical protein